MNNLSCNGRLVRDVEVKQTNNGQSLAVFTIANDVGWGDKKTTNFFRCTIWGKRAESGLIQYLKKGQEVIVTGEFKANEYESKGEKRIGLEINVADLSLVGGKKDASAAPQASTPAYLKPDAAPEPDFTDLIPF